MKRLLLTLVAASSVAALSACGSAEVVVQAQTAVTEGAEPVALKDLQIRLLPYDRDAIFADLEAQYPEPEPQIPDTLNKLQDAVRIAQEEWKQAEARWGVVRDSLKVISDEMQRMGPSGRARPEYVAMFRDFQNLEPQEQGLNRQMETAFNRFTSLQEEMVAMSQEYQLIHNSWADQAYASYDSVILEKLKTLKLTELADTTDATGVARFAPKPGSYWLVARYELPYQELYWNVPVQVSRGEPVQVRLTRENAELRRKL